MSSIQAQCREAMNRLAARGVTFTERDVVNMAAMPNWLPRQHSKAQRAAYAVLQGDYRRGRLCRFGPVDMPDSDDQDYVRNESKVVYASAERGPAAVDTPNGVFRKMLADDDTISRVGRRPGIDRDDFKPWDQQGAHEPVRESEPESNGNGNGTLSESELDALATILAPKVAAKLADAVR